MSESQMNISISAKEQVSQAFNRVNAKMIGFQNTVKGMEPVFKKMAMVGTASFVGLTYKISGATREFMAFQDQMTNVSTLISGNSTKVIGELQKKVLELTKTMPISAEQLGASAYDILSSGIKGVDNQISTLNASAKLSIGGLGQLAGGVDLMTSAINAFGLEARDADYIADVVFKTVKNGKTTVDQLKASFGSTAPVLAAAGVSLEEFSAMTAALTTNGLSASIAQTQLKQATIELQKPGKVLAEFMQKAGVNANMLANKSIGLKGVLKILGEYAKKTGVSLTEIFGSSEAMQAAISVNNMYDQINENLKDMTEGANALSEAYGKQMEAMSKKVNLLQNSFSRLNIAIGGAFSGNISSAADAIAPIIDKITEWINANPELTAQILSLSTGLGGLTAIAGGLGLVIGPLSKGFMMMYKPIAMLWGGIDKLVLGIFKLSRIFTVFMVGLGPLGIAIGLIVGAAILLALNWDKVKAVTECVWEKLKEFGVWLGEIFKSWIDSLIETFTLWKDSILAVWTGVQFLWEVVKNFVKKGLEILFSKITNVKNGFLVFKESLISVYSYIKEKLIGVFETIENKISGLISKLKSAWEWIKKVTSGLGQNISKGWDSAVSYASDMMSSVSSGLNFADGGIVNAPLGAPVTATVHGGEMIIPARDVGKQKGGSINININGGVFLDESVAEKISNLTLEKLKTEIRF